MVQDSPASAAPKRDSATDGQSQVDAVQAQFRAETGQRKSIRRDPPPRPPDIPPSDDPLSQRLGDELDYARRLIEQMGDALSADPTIFARHVVTLQSVDVVGQMLGHIASVVRSSDPASMVERIGMGDLKARLQRRGGV